MGWGFVQSNKTAATASAISSVACTYTSNVSSGTSLIAYATTSTQTGTTDTVATVKDGAGIAFSGSCTLLADPPTSLMTSLSGS